MTLRNLFAGAAAFAALSLGAPAFAAINYTPGTGATLGSVTCGSDQCPKQTPVDASGSALFSSSNPGNVGGQVGAFLDGWNVTEGTKADTASCATTHTLIACLRQTDADIVTLNTTLGTSTPAGSNIIGKVGNGAFYAETTTALGSAAVYTGSAHDTGVTAGSPQPYAYFSAFFLADQSGTAEVDGSPDGTTWYQMTKASDGALTASTPLILSVPVLFRYYRAKLTNGATAQGSLIVASGFTGG